MAEIKISELSIGDWVRYDRGTDAVQIMGIYVRNNQELVVMSDSYFPDGVIGFVECIKPIPLTPEILEKNGFTRWVQGSNKGDYYLDIPRTKRVWLYYDFGTYKMAYIRNTGGCETFFKCRDIASVHQLQHALRLAGVEKEIEV